MALVSVSSSRSGRSGATRRAGRVREAMPASPRPQPTRLRRVSSRPVHVAGPIAGCGPGEMGWDACVAGDEVDQLGIGEVGHGASRRPDRADDLPDATTSGQVRTAASLGRPGRPPRAAQPSGGLHQQVGGCRQRAPRVSRRKRRRWARHHPTPSSNQTGVAARSVTTTSRSHGLSRQDNARTIVDRRRQSVILWLPRKPGTQASSGERPFVGVVLTGQSSNHECGL